MTGRQKKQFKPLLRALNNWEKEILNYFKYGFTNAYTEGMNNMLGTIQEVGRGYSFDVLRAKVIHRPQHKFQVVGHGLDMTGFMLKRDLGVPFSTFNEPEPTDLDSTPDYG